MSRRLLLSFLVWSAFGGVTPAAELVEITDVDPTIQIELRYASEDNIAGRRLYPKGFSARLQRLTAERLRHAQALLKKQGLGLKIWDAYRTKEVQEELWNLHPDRSFVTPPEEGSLHMFGVAIDATLVDLTTGEEKRMPSDFDEFGPNASYDYRGLDQEIRRNLRTLQDAMKQAGFRGMRTEWWHFVDKDWKSYKSGPTPGAALPATKSEEGKTDEAGANKTMRPPGN